MLAVILSASAACWGSPTFELIVENQSKYDLTIYVNGNYKGNISPGVQITKMRLPWDVGQYYIEAKNTEGEIIFSKTLTRAQMQRIESRVYKVVIPPLKNVPKSDNVTGKQVAFRSWQF
jgi:hypothetical protein